MPMDSEGNVTVNRSIDLGEGATQEQILPTSPLRPWVIVRTFSAGVHYGELVSQNGKEVVLTKTRRFYYWSGAMSLSQIALEGVKNPDKCKFSVIIPENRLTEAIEIMPVTLAAKRNIDSVPIWKM
jgi:hypothetical protein